MRQRPERVWLGYCAAVALLLAGASTHAVAGDVMVRGSGPKAVLDAYQRAMEKGLSDPDLAIYSERSKRMMAQRGVSEAQMRNTADSLRRCSMDSVTRQGGRAVVYAPVSERKCPPYLFVREQGQWRLDLAAMYRAFRMNQSNQWRLLLDASSPYWFAFEDWEFNEKGFPVAQ